MKKFIAYIASLPIFFASCSTIEEPERLVAMEDVVPQRAVLLEEFTGQKCTNCPDAHKTISDLKEQYGSSLIAVSIHGGPANFMRPEDVYEDGLNNAEGDYYAEKWGINSLPAGIVDRTSGITVHQSWAAKIAEDIVKPTDVSIELKASINEQGDAIIIDSTLKPTEDLNGYLQLWVIESNIVAMQKNGRETINDYVHNHVYRAAVNDLDGEAVELKANLFDSFSHSISLKDKWNPDNLSIVAFIYNDSEGVIQAAECDVTR